MNDSFENERNHFSERLKQKRNGSFTNDEITKKNRTYPSLHTVRSRFKKDSTAIQEVYVAFSMLDEYSKCISL